VDPNSKRSQDLLTETNALMGRGSAGAPARADAASTPSVVHHYHQTINQTINPSADIDINALTQMVSREMALRMRTAAA
jgi:hypothetical protein